MNEKIKYLLDVLTLRNKPNGGMRKFRLIKLCVGGLDNDSEYNQVMFEFINGWQLSVVIDNGKYNVMTYFNGDQFNEEYETVLEVVEEIESVGNYR